ncbi:MAG: polymer-forming cytoskeletal protein [Deltaproteobacteria bacterium]|nr:polymer-forming cytoskeletal protein [Deltaproteobacteria bacterium]
MALVQEQRTHAPETNTLLGRGSEFEGKLVFEGTVHINGKLKGHIFSDDVLVVGEGADVQAEIEVGTVLVYGSVTGNIKASRSIELHAPGRIRGNIATPNLMVEQGTIFQGACTMDGVGAPQQGGKPAAAVPAKAPANKP